ncbi:collagen alpha-1(I) chain-like [Sarcophilus harrisii]|uniref:collagen alpha-1(I) chain-like n=1 Tax=Sarcophilus harrisii TaxID=9305 RepID=UPI001301AF50|nr:collagen alpha-1(I) chain-like [Sarcophilus harrisii]
MSPRIPPTNKSSQAEARHRPGCGAPRGAVWPLLRLSYWGPQLPASSLRLKRRRGTIHRPRPRSPPASGPRNPLKQEGKKEARGQRPPSSIPILPPAGRPGKARDTSGTSGLRTHTPCPQPPGHFGLERPNPGTSWRRTGQGRVRKGEARGKRGDTWGSLLLCSFTDPSRHCPPAKSHADFSQAPTFRAAAEATSQSFLSGQQPRSAEPVDARRRHVTFNRPSAMVTDVHPAGHLGLPEDPRWGSKAREPVRTPLAAGGS